MVDVSKGLVRHKIDSCHYGVMCLIVIWEGLVAVLYSMFCGE